MHVVIVDTTFTTPPTGGAHTFLVDLSAALVGRGARVSIVSQPGPDQTIARALGESGAEVAMKLWQRRHLPEEKASRLANWVNQESPDAYVVSQSPDAGWLTLPLLDSSIATFTIAHNDVGAFYEPLKHYHSFVDCAIGVSEAIHKIVRECGVPAERARHIPYGVQPVALEQLAERRSDLERPLAIGYVGRIVQEQKRVMDFVPLVRELAKRNVPFQLQIIGDGPDRSELEGQLKTTGVAEQVEFTGWLSPEKVKEKLRILDVFLLLSDYEGLPVALLEALAHGVVPVVTRIESGNTQLVRDGENGFVLPVGDMASFAARLESLSSDRDALAAFGRTAWETSQQYSIEKMADNYTTAFTEVAQRVSTRHGREGVGANYPVMNSCRSKYPFWLRRIKQRVVTLGFLSNDA
ncbi:MAG TPA: glycosyltransferase family 4 protein [Pyrinomonadaceae bacterium]|nr:glycosyltransferase family 4 protein [Pyrinomonadaceae bacterium]